MSYDLLTTPTACDHRVARERLAITPDRRTLYSLERTTQRMARQVNGTNTVRLYVDGVEVPRDHATMGWDVVPDELSVREDRWYKIVFARRQQTLNWVIEVEYATTARYCRKCRGTSLVSDYQPGPYGRWKHVEGRSKLVQRCMKLVLTSICPFYPALTCALRSRIAKKGGNVFTSDDAAEEVTSVLSKLKTIQQSQAKFQTLAPQEILRGVSQVSAKNDPRDPRVIGVSLTILSYGDTSDPITLGLTKG